MENHTAPDDATRKADLGLQPEHKADRGATNEESKAAEDHEANMDPGDRAKVAKHEKDMMETGAEVQGEGAID
jgi:hypothetical protein